MTSETRTDTSYGRSLLDRVLQDIPATDSRLTHIAEVPGRCAQQIEWPGWVAPGVVEAVRDVGIEAPWSHQAETAEFAHNGQHVVLSTGTASGKSLGYQLPVLTALHDDPQATALYIAPTKALGADQLRMVGDLTRHPALRNIAAASYDGDTPPEVRRWVRADAHWLFTNPDMVHLGLLRSHRRWARLLRRLRYVVVDECHAYRGVFGSHVALVLRRLRRLAAHYGADPVFVLCSATAADPAAAASRLIGAECVAVTEDGSARGPQTVAFWEPPLLTSVNGAPVRLGATTESARITADLVREGARTLTFARSRRSAELIALHTRQLLAETDPELAERVAAYRGGYLPEERRALEAGLSDGTILAAATTNALELGVDIAGLDAVVLAGFPGTVASFRQQIGRAGRRTQGALALLVARDDPLDTYLVHHPEALLDRPVEAAIIDPTNPHVLGPQLLCAAMELPIDDTGIEGLDIHRVLGELAVQGMVRRRRTTAGHHWFHTGAEPPHGTVDIRGGIGAQVAIVVGETGRFLGTTDSGRAPATLHAGAVHLHQGETYVVDELDLEGGVAFVREESPGWTTSARRHTSLTIDSVRERREFGQVAAALATVTVRSQVIGYLRTSLGGEVLDVVELDLPPQLLPTTAVLYTVTTELLERAGIDPADVPGVLHAAEHAAIGLLPLVATCDRWDIGGVSTAQHADTGLPTVFVYDGQAGGAGFAERGYVLLRRWLGATLAAVESCACRSGCPSCVQSPKCGNGNEPLDKAGACRLLTVILSELAGPGRSSGP